MRSNRGVCVVLLCQPRSTIVPKTAIKSTGRRPYLSDARPSTGVKITCDRVTVTSSTTVNASSVSSYMRTF